MVSIVFGGDFSPQCESAASLLLSRGYLWDDSITGFISEADLRIINLETTLGAKAPRRPKIGANLKTHEKMSEVLKQSKIDMVSMANNHIFDFGSEGVQDTINFLQASKIKYGGVGESPRDANKLHILEINGERIGFLFYAEHEFNYISEDEPGTAVLDPSGIILKIQESIIQCDYLILFTHFGPEGTGCPSPRMVSLFHNFVKAGASVVINCHAHHVMGMEFYNDKPIYYGLGNLFFPKPNMPDWWNKGMLVKINLTRNAITTKELFTTYEDKYVEMNPNQMKAREYFNEISSWIKSPSIVEKKWKDFCKNQTPHMLDQIIKGVVALLPYYFSIKLKFPYYKKMTLNSLPAKGARLLRGLFSCENHVEELSSIFTDIGLR